MGNSLLVLTCALALGQSPDGSGWLLAPQLPPGLELVYTGTHTEEILVPNVQFRRTYDLETTVLVLKQQPRTWDVAVMTALRMRGSRPENGPKVVEVQPHSVRLETLSVDRQGRVSSGQGVSCQVPLSGPPTLECGAFVECPVVRVGRQQIWEVNEVGRPPRSFQVAGTENCNGASCIKLVSLQQSDDWDHPRADREAWRRKDTLWVSPQLGIAYRVERSIERREPARRDPTSQTLTRYDLDNRLRYPGKLFEDRLNEITRYQKLQDEAAPLLRQPALYRPQIDALLKRLSWQMEGQAPTPYRKALVALQHRIEAGRRGEPPPDAVGDEKTESVKTLSVGQRAPDFVVSELTGKDSARLYRHLGRPVLIFFYNPTTENGKNVSLFARELAEKHQNNLALLALAVTGDAELVRRQKAEWKLPFPIHDGRGLHLTFGVDATPRLILLDSEGIVRGAYTGWAHYTPREIGDELARWLPR